MVKRRHWALPWPFWQPCLLLEHFRLVFWLFLFALEAAAGACLGRFPRLFLLAMAPRHPGDGLHGPWPLLYLYRGQNWSHMREVEVIILFTKAKKFEHVIEFTKSCFTHPKGLEEKTLSKTTINVKNHS